MGIVTLTEMPLDVFPSLHIPVVVVQRITHAKLTLAASRAELELAEKRYTAGLADIVELEEAQRSYTADDAAYANALYAFSVAKAAVDQATARSLAGS